MAEALKAIRIRACRRPAGANSNRRTDIETIALLQPRGEISGNRGGNTNGPLVRQRVNQCGQSHDSRFSGHSRKARGFLPGVDIEPRKRGKDA